MYKLYKHTAPNNKVYIGITQQNIKKRWQNGNGYKSNKYFFSAIQKYGWDNIKHEILFEDLSKEQAERLEKEYIQKYKSYNMNFGYNIDKGGLIRALSKKEKEQISKRNRERVLSKESKEKISRSLKEYYRNNPVSQETRRKIAEANYKRDCSFWRNKKLSLEHRKNIGKGIKNSKKYKMAICKKVLCVETKMIFNSIVEAEEFLKIKKYHSTIGRVLNNSKRTSNGYHWISL